MNSESPPTIGFQRRLGLDSVMAFLVGHVIGIGIFLTPAGMSKSLGSPVLVGIVWVFMGCTAFCGALCFAELASRHPDAGGPYIYLREAWGSLPAFLYGWKSLFVMDPGLTAALAAGFAANVAVLVPLSPRGARGVAVAAVLVLAIGNLLGTSRAVGVVRLLTAAKVALLVLLIVWGFASGAGHWGHFLPLLGRRPGSSSLPAALGGAIVAAFFSYGGWWEVSKLAGEVREPSRTLPRALALGIGALTSLYLLTSAVFVYLVPMDAVGSGETFAAQAGAVLIGPRGAQIFAALVALFALGSLAPVMTLFPRVYYALARDGAFFRAVGTLNPRTGTPARAVVVQAALATALLAVGTFGEIVAYFIFVTVAFLGLTVAGLFVLRRREASPGFAAPGFPIPAVVFLVSIAVVLALLAMGAPKQAALGSGVVALGVPAYYLRRRYA
ncbi:MAG: amino acid permease [Acidobacteria bacterium]|nr:amino acid permease [Acidobacteriota bacterium]